jgi:hypothetical protein
MPEQRPKLTLPASAPPSVPVVLPPAKPEAPPAAPATPAQPKLIQLLRQHSFIEEGTGRHRMWKAGEKIADAGEIALLIRRGATYEAIG